MYDLLLRNLHAERLGDWDEYITSLKLMVPYFASTGHRAYAKCVSWFLEDLDEYTISTF